MIQIKPNTTVTETGTIRLRPYQEALTNQARQSVRQGHKRIILQAPTGAGKTRVAAAIIQSALDKQKYVLLIVERRELVYQTSRAFEALGMPNDIIMAGEEQLAVNRLRVASKDTLFHRGLKNAKMAMPWADVLCIDEAHLSLSRSWRAIFEHYRDSVVIGLTATPVGTQGLGLGAVYDDLILSPPMQWFVDNGYLVPARYFEPSTPDLGGVKVDPKTGDYVVNQAAERVDIPELIGDICTNWRRIANNRPTIVFCCNRKHAQHVTHEFMRIGVSTAYIDGETPKDARNRIFKGIRDGSITVVVNVFVMSYGVDLPMLECAVMARPTKDLRMWLQTAGRVLRPSKETGKTQAIIIDHAGIRREHGYLTDTIPWSLDGKESVYERREKIKRDERKENPEPKDIKCVKCTYVFRARRDCPNCGFVAITKGEPIPVIEAELKEVRQDEEEGLQAQRNRTISNEAKAWFYGQLKQYATDKGYKPGWAVHKYKSRYDVLPWESGVESAPMRTVTKNVANWIKHEQIRWAKRRTS